MAKKEAKTDEKEYRTLQFQIKKGDDLFDYCDDLCFKSKNIYNVGMFHLRQLMTGLKKDKALVQKLEAEVIQKVESSLSELNDIKEREHEKKNKKRLENGKDELDFKPYEMPTAEKWFLSKNLLDGVLKLENNVDYRAIPTQSSQGTLSLLYQDWKSYFEINQLYIQDPSALSGRPRLPRYAKKTARKTAIISNQDAVIYSKGTKYLKLPKTKLTFPLDKAKLPEEEDLKQVRIVPSNHFYLLELVFEVPKVEVKTTLETAKRIIALDLGVNNFATITNNFGQAPLIVKGGILKNKNQWYNKHRAHFVSVLRQGKQSNEGPFTSKRLKRLDTKRHAFLKDYFHKASKQVVTYCLEHQVDTIVIGKNKGWKTDVKLQKKDKQSFIQLPFNLFIQLLTYKAKAQGILVIETEESYTSKASFLDRDDMPVYGELDGDTQTFKGYRASRGRYKSYKHGFINADVNGSANILRKVFPRAFTDRDKGILKMPQSLLVAWDLVLGGNIGLV